jgi:two-component system response regulator FlrC
MSDGRILVVEDDSALREALEETLQDAGHTVCVAGDGAEAMLMIERACPSLVVTDVQMSPVNGLELLASLREHHPEVPVVLMTAYGSIEQAVTAMQRGAMDYLAKPFEASALIEMVERYLPAVQGGTDDLIACDAKTLALVALARRLAANDLTVMISGESGTGKEVFARFIHRQSCRADAPFIAINCAAIPENMLEAMLFGYEKGAFTGAQTAHPGKFEQAQGGTLLLDEISEMGQPLQAKLLRVLQEREVERLGGRKVMDLDVRVIATTNRDLKAEVTQGNFREDLFYRLNVLPLNLPPLRERVGDILPLAEDVLLTSPGGGPQRFSSAAAARLTEYHWPGNVRELTNLVQRAAVLSDGSVIEAEHLLFETAPARVASVDLPLPVEALAVAEDEASQVVSLEEDLRAREREVIFEALRSGGGSREAAAARLGISPRTLRHKLARLREEGAEIPGEVMRTA